MSKCCVCDRPRTIGSIVIGELTHSYCDACFADVREGLMGYYWKFLGTDPRRTNLSIVKKVLQKNEIGSEDIENLPFPKLLKIYKEVLKEINR